MKIVKYVVAISLFSFFACSDDDKKAMNNLETL